MMGETGKGFNKDERDWKESGWRGFGGLGKMGNMDRGDLAEKYALGAGMYTEGNLHT